MVLEQEIHVRAIVDPVWGVEAQLADRACIVPSLCKAVANVEQQRGRGIHTCRTKLVKIELTNHFGMAWNSQCCDDQR